MCTAISTCGTYHFFGRTLDVEGPYGEMAVITPRNFGLVFRHVQALPQHLAIAGIACIQKGVPLYFDAVNEAGLAMAGLNFPKNAVYHNALAGKQNLGSFELIPWVLSQCKTVSSAIELLQNANIMPDSFSPDLPATPLHWIIADRERAITVEPVRTGLEIHENPFGVLTNNPPFLHHVTYVSNFMRLDAAPPQNRLCPSVELERYSYGMGAMGFPGDFSSTSRFVRAVFAKEKAAHATALMAEVSRFFHIMDTVAVPRGCVKTSEGNDLFTAYTSCVNTDTLTYYFTTADCRRIRAVDFGGAMLDGAVLIQFSMCDKEDILYLTADNKS